MFWPLVGLGASFLGGALSNRDKKSQSTSKTMPIELPEYEPIQRQIMTMLMSNLGKSADMSGFQAVGMDEINDLFAGNQKAIENRLASQGLLGSPVAGHALSSNEISRAGQLAKFNAQLPVLRHQLMNEDLNNAIRFYLSRPIGEETTGTAIQSGNKLGGGFNSFGAMLGYLIGSGRLGGRD